MTEPRLLITSETNRYPVFIESDIRFKSHDLILSSLEKAPSSYMIIADETVAGYYLDDVLQSFPDSIKPHVSLVPSGESSKSFSRYEQLLTEALEYGLDRESVIIALGGGVTGDVAGFTASTFMRGIRYVQMPTTLLAHDSSVGGKTGINHSLGKNLIGTFHPPAAVIYDSAMLYTLPEKEWRSGFAEVIKHSLIADLSFLDWLEEHVTSFVSVKKEVLNELLHRSIAVKADIVEKDEKEHGVRAFLNLGHTLGHSIEAEAGYGRMTHGEAVAVGIIFALNLSEQLLDAVLPVERTRTYMERLGYDLSVPTDCNSGGLLARMKIDKKAARKKIRFVLLESPAKPVLAAVEDKDILKLLEKGREAG